MTSVIAASMGAFAFMVYEWITSKKPTLLGFCTGVLGGLVAITPSADAVSPLGAMAMGIFGAIVAAWGISLKRRHGLDDSLDVFAVHGMAGIAGAIYEMFLGNPAAPAGFAGVFRGGELSLLWREPAAIIVTLVFAFGVSWLILEMMSQFMELRISDEDEVAGIDLAEHHESAYDTRTANA
ncbi:MAG: hypothetical protein L0K64_01665 [Corynebacterium flavescens]|nr:hypothetical protein [Corynebacterium flavescens]MDN6530831.1 hypothetical protein [Corynebacterium flavescens]